MVEKRGSSNNPEIVAKKEQLPRQTSIGKFFSDVHDIAAADALARTRLWRVGTKITEERAQALLEKKDFSGIGSEIYPQALAQTCVRNRIERTLIEQTVQGTNNLGLSEVEKTTVKAHAQLGEPFDKLFVQWRERINNDPEGTKALLDKQPNKYLYVVAQQTEEPEQTGVKLVPYATAFPKQVTVIGQRLDRLVTDLEGINPSSPSEADERDRLVTYYSALRAGMTSQDQTQHEVLFDRVDTVWRELTGRMIPVHMVEATDDPHGRRVNPELFLGFKDDREPELNKKIQALREPLATAINAISPSAMLTKETDSGVFVGFGAGRRLHFDPTGQALPNRPGVRLEKGVGTIINLEQVERNRAGHETLVARAFVETPSYDTESLNRARALFIAGHEIAHNAFMGPDTIKKLGTKYELLEEVKSDMATFAALPEFVKNPKEQDIILSSLLGNRLFYLKYGKPAGRLNYYHTGVASLRAMIDTGVIQQEGDNFKFVLNEQTKTAFFQKTKNVATALAEVYNAPAGEVDAKATDFLQRYAGEPQEGEMIAQLAAKL